MNHLSYRQAVKELESLPVMPERVPSLAPTSRALKRLGLEFPDSRVVIVAGTNGKGTVCACLETLLLEAGQSTGLYTSPHLIETTERFRRDGVDITGDELALAYEEVRSRTRDLSLTHFELLTLMGFWIFAGGGQPRPVDWLILEVGLGGTWDATNAIPHRNCIITSLGMDHQNLLGNSLHEIAANKFGVIPKLEPPAKVIHAPFAEELSLLARKIEREQGASFICCAPWRCDVKPGPSFVLSTRWGSAPLSVPGNRGGQNAAIALTAFEALGFDPARAMPALSRVRWPGRMEKVEISGSPCPIYLSGDHNPQGIESLLDLLKFYPRKQLHLLVGIGKDKDMDGILAPLRELPDARLFLTTTPFRGRAFSDYGHWLGLADGGNPDPASALDEVLSQVSAEDLVVVTGSLYLVGSIRALAKKQPFQK